MTHITKTGNLNKFVTITTFSDTNKVAFILYFYWEFFIGNSYSIFKHYKKQKAYELQTTKHAYKSINI